MNPDSSTGENDTAKDEGPVIRQTGFIFDDGADKAIRHILYAGQVQENGREPANGMKSTRSICQGWPRPPSSPAVPTMMTGNRSPDPATPVWGATLLDFYWFERISGCLTPASSNQIFASVNPDELSFAQSQVAWAKYAPGPALKSTPYTLPMIGKYIKSIQEPPRAEGILSAEDTHNPEVQMPLAFDHQCYPKPWPLKPFSSEPPTLRDLLPLHALPKKLYVHDPENILSVKGSNSENDLRDPWQPEGDHISHTYVLSLSQEGKAKESQELKDIEQVEKRASTRLYGFMIYPEDPPNAYIPPPTFISIPPPPIRPRATPEAHLYLDEMHSLGSGHHSRVYQAEYEIPLHLVSGPEICIQCVLEDVQDVDSNFCGDYIDPSTLYSIRYQPSERRYSDMGPLEKPTHPVPWNDGGSSLGVLGKYSLGTVTKEFRFATISDESGNDLLLKSHNRDVSNAEYFASIKKDKTGMESTFVRIDEPCYAYIGPLRIIQSNISWCTPGLTPLCKHRFHEFVLPTATVRVAAKLSIEGDPQLVTEAQNYQKFPKHFFQHWSGYYLVPPVHHPVPCVPIVPQFYGYYVKENESEDEGKDYHSPILLLEQCGMQVSSTSTSLTLDERREAASLLHRFHRNGWVQGSVYPRNFLVEEREWDTDPNSRLPRQNKSFRMIDFGRASTDPVTLNHAMQGEKTEVNKIFATGMYEHMSEYTSSR